MSGIGVGIVTYNREDKLKRLYDSLPLDIIDSLVIVNDGKPLSNLDLKCATLINNNVNLGVGKSKNKALNFLLSKDIEYFFIIEDDLFIKDSDVFFKYIEACNVTGIQHFNFALHGLLNVNIFNKANPKCNIKYNNVKLSLYENCVGAFSFFTKKCLLEIGLFDENYYNALEHVDHTFKIIKNGFHPPFWYFADLENSNKYIGDDGWSIKTSVISSNSQIKKYQNVARGFFYYKNGIDVLSIQNSNINLVKSSLDYINMKYGDNSELVVKPNQFNFLLHKLINKFCNLILKNSYFFK